MISVNDHNNVGQFDAGQAGHFGAGVHDGALDLDHGASLNMGPDPGVAVGGPVVDAGVQGGAILDAQASAGGHFDAGFHGQGHNAFGSTNGKTLVSLP